MNLQELVKKINACVDDVDLVAARKYLEENKTLLMENRNLLKRNARELFDFLNNSSDSDSKPLTREELAATNAINLYASRFDLRGLKIAVKNHSELLLREEITPYLNEDARILLEGMGAIQKAKS
jgi:regulator of replication initiation timing